MNAEEVLLRDAFLLGLELKLSWFVTFLCPFCFVTGTACLIPSIVSISKTLNFEHLFVFPVYTI